MDGINVDLEIKAEKLDELKSELAVKIANSVSGIEELIAEYKKVSADLAAIINILAAG